jgi:NADH:ubiquinone oxidoreductase subunit F (NADH-binding)
MAPLPLEVILVLVVQETDPTDDGGYVDNTIVSEGPFCLVEGQFL